MLKIKREPVSASVSEHLRTDHLLHNIGRRAVSGGFVTVGAQAAKFALNIGGVAILARLLTASEFGLVGMVLAITGLAGIFNTLGLSTATVQRQDITQKQVSNLFWINIAASGIVTIVCSCLAPVLAWFYRDSRVGPIMLAMSLVFLLRGSTVQHRALLTRQMRFLSIGIIDVTSMFVGFATACVLAWRGFSYWALVAQQLSNALAGLVLTWCVSKWRPSLPSRGSSVRSLASFGAHLSAADFVYLFLINADGILIGRFLGPVSLGLYTRASALLNRPLEQIFVPINTVMDPVLSRLQSDPEQYRRTFLRTFSTLIVLSFSFSAMCLALSRPLVLFILGPNWEGVIPLFSASALLAVSVPVGTVVCWLYQSQGRGKDQLQSHFITGAVTFVSYLVGLIWGPLGLIISVAVATATIELPILYYIGGRTGPVSTRDLSATFFSKLPVWGAIYIATFAARMAVAGFSPFVQLLVSVPTGLLAGGALLMPFPSFREDARFVSKAMKEAIMQQLASLRARLMKDT
jgi:O-antigen/teichoic acid export membrane protein